MTSIPLSDETVGRKIDEMVRRIVEHVKPDRIVLFGSHARGRARPDSDVDLLVVVRDGDDIRALTVRLYRLLAGMGVPKDLVVVTLGEFERFKDVPGTVVRAAHLEGRVLYVSAS
jgi:predicted nucleotidyltransferase